MEFVASLVIASTYTVFVEVDNCKQMENVYVQQFQAQIIWILYEDKKSKSCTTVKYQYKFYVK